MRALGWPRAPQSSFLMRWQRCVVHWYRNIFSHVPSTKVREIAAMLKAIHAGEDLAAAREKAIRVHRRLAATTRKKESTGPSPQPTLPAVRHAILELFARLHPPRCPHCQKWIVTEQQRE